MEYFILWNLSAILKKIKIDNHDFLIKRLDEESDHIDLPDLIWKISLKFYFLYVHVIFMYVHLYIYLHDLSRYIL